MRKCSVILSLLLMLYQHANATTTFNDTNAGYSVRGSSALKIKNQLRVSNGKVQQGQSAKIKGTAVNLNNGSFAVENGINTVFTGVLNPNTNQITVNNATITNQPGQVGQKISVSGNSSLTGIPSNFTNSTGIALSSPSTTLSLGVSTPISTNIGLNGGTLFLNGSTKLGDGKAPVGNGTINFNKNRFEFGGAPITLGGILTLNSANDLVLNSDITVTGKLIFSGDSQVSGNGNLIDLSLGGTIAIRPNTNVSMTNVVLRGLGLGKLLFYSKTSQLTLSNVQIELDRNYTVTMGGIYAEGPTNVVTANRTLTFSQAGSATVDNISLTYDTLRFLNQNNIQPLAANDPHHKNLTLLNNAVVVPINNFSFATATSNTILFLSKNNSNAIVALKAVSLTPDITGLIRATSRLAANNSNAIRQLAPIVRGNSRWLRTTSNALQFGLKNLSNALLFGDRNNSNTLLYNERTDSNAKLFLAKNLSNALLFGFRTTSNASSFLSRQNSNAINQLAPIVRGNSRWLRTTSNALLFGLKNLSNALLFGDRNNSNTLLAFVINNTTLAAELVSTSSAFIVEFARQTSNALLATEKNNSNAIVRLNREQQTIFGPETTKIVGTSGTLLYDIYLSADHLMTVDSFTNTCVIDGHGHTIHFASGASNILQIPASVKVLFQNVVFQNYNDAAIGLGAGSGVVFGDGARLELNDTQQLQRNMTFKGSSELRGYGNKLSLSPFSIAVSPHSTLSLQNISLDSLNSNILCGGPTSSLILRDANLCLENNYNFTSGSILFSHEVVMTGTNNFIYASNISSTIDSCTELLMDGAGFSYAPSIPNRGLLAMTDQTSIFHIRSSALTLTTTGMQLTNGTFLVEGKNPINNPGAVAASEGFGLGNGNGANDVSVLLKGCATLNMVSGVLDYQNVDA